MYRTKWVAPLQNMLRYVYRGFQAWMMIAAKGRQVSLLIRFCLKTFTKLDVRPTYLGSYSNWVGTLAGWNSNQNKYWNLHRRKEKDIHTFKYMNGAHVHDVTQKFMYLNLHRRNEKKMTISKTCQYILRELRKKKTIKTFCNIAETF
jgi:hypothetical protein